MQVLEFWLKRKQFSGPFILRTDNSKVLMLPPDYIDAVNEQSELSFREYTKQVRRALASFRKATNIYEVVSRSSCRITTLFELIDHRQLACLTKQ